MTWHYIWTNQNRMSDADKHDNAQEIWNRLTSYYGFTPQSAAAIIANFQYEGFLNPCQWQLGSTIGDWDNESVGLGLGQWTPPSKLDNKMGGNRTEADIANGELQVDITATDTTQWVQRVNKNGYSTFYNRGGIPYITSIYQFSRQTYPPEDLATCWCACWEGCTKSEFNRTYNSRRQAARYWFNVFYNQGTEHFIYIDVIGNGTAVARPSIAVENETVRLTCTPYDEDQLEYIDARDPYGASIALEQVEDQTFLMKPYDIYITVKFTGETPPPPIFRKRKSMPLWMMANRHRNVFVIK